MNMKKGFVKFCLLLVGSIFGGVTTGAAVVAGNWMLAGAAMLLHVAVLIKIADMFYKAMRELEQARDDLNQARTTQEVYRAILMARDMWTGMAVAEVEAANARLASLYKRRSDVSGS